MAAASTEKGWKLGSQPLHLQEKTLARTTLLVAFLHSVCPVCKSLQAYTPQRVDWEFNYVMLIMLRILDWILNWTVRFFGKCGDWFLEEGRWANPDYWFLGKQHLMYFWLEDYVNKVSCCFECSECQRALLTQAGTCENWGISSSVCSCWWQILSAMAEPFHEWGLWEVRSLASLGCK